MNKQFSFEVCCGSVEDVIQAYMNGANRIELNSALYLGGLTPSLATFIKSKEITSIPIVCMIRSRGAGFNYSKIEIETMLLDAKLLLENGADGIAFGALNTDYSIDVETTHRFVNLAHQYNKEFVFHRAIDCTHDIFASMKDLVNLKVDRVLTSGTYTTALEGSKILNKLHLEFGDTIEILVGGGVNSSNISQLINLTTCSQYHSSCKAWFVDVTTSNSTMSYAYGSYSSHYDGVDGNLVEILSRTLNLTKKS